MHTYNFARRLLLCDTHDTLTNAQKHETLYRQFLLAVFRLFRFWFCFFFFCVDFRYFCDCCLPIKIKKERNEISVAKISDRLVRGG